MGAPGAGVQLAVELVDDLAQGLPHALHGGVLHLGDEQAHLAGLRALAALGGAAGPLALLLGVRRGPPKAWAADVAVAVAPLGTGVLGRGRVKWTCFLIRSGLLLLASFLFLGDPGTEVMGRNEYSSTTAVREMRWAGAKEVACDL